VPEKLWVKYEDKKVTGVSTEKCKDVDDFKAQIVKVLKLKESPGDFDVYVEGNLENSLDPMMLLRDAVAKHGIRSDTVLIAKLIQPQGGKSSFFSIF
jgi:hypothetical protein